MLEINIPLGRNCLPAHFLRQQRHRRYSLPFDWSITPFRSIIEISDSQNVSHICRENYLILPKTYRQVYDEDKNVVTMKDSFIYPLIDKKYQILYPHHLTEPSDLDFLITKFRKRLIRYFRIIKLIDNGQLLANGVYSSLTLSTWQRTQYCLADVEFNDICHNEFTQWLNKKKISSWHLK